MRMPGCKNSNEKCQTRKTAPRTTVRVADTLQPRRLNLGTFPSRAAAEKHERAVQFERRVTMGTAVIIGWEQRRERH